MFALKSTIKENHKAIICKIEQAKAQAELTCHVVLIAVSKKQSIEAIQALYDCGEQHFGENYVDEGLQKIEKLKNLHITWHFIGHLQSNKTSKIAQYFDWFHALDSEKIAKRLHTQRPKSKKPLNVCIQINISSDPNKNGIHPKQLKSLVESILLLDKICLRGLMTIPSQEMNPDDSFQKMNALFKELQNQLQTDKRAQIDTLSMGMSGDFERAIAYGANTIRVGTALFGPRT